MGFEKMLQQLRTLGARAEDKGSVPGTKRFVPLTQVPEV